MNESTSAAVAAEHSARLTLAVLVSLAVVTLLAVVAFWPAHAWLPPRRPALKAPVVFDEFVNPPPASSADPSASAQ